MMERTKIYYDENNCNAWMILDGDWVAIPAALHHFTTTPDLGQPDVTHTVLQFEPWDYTIPTEPPRYYFDYLNALFADESAPEELRGFFQMPNKDLELFLPYHADATKLYSASVWNLHYPLGEKA
jgi:hypothetical protein